MKVRFHVNYRTAWGQKLFVAGSLKQLGNWDTQNALEMSHTYDGNWECEIDITKKTNNGFEYKYFVLYEESNSIQWEWGDNRKLSDIHNDVKQVDLLDKWIPSNDIDNSLFTSAFVNAIMRRKKGKKIKTESADTNKKNYRFQINNPRIDANHKMCVVGSDKALGDWDDKKPLVMDDSDFPVWKVNANITETDCYMTYKYAICDNKGNIITWENGENRDVWLDPEKNSKNFTIVSDEKFRFPIGNWKGAGVNIPVFSLRSKNGLGVGEFLDIKLLVDWAKKVGIKMIQVLPVNDTVATHSWIDSYPYSAISVFALHPLHLNLHAIGDLSAKITQEIIDHQKDVLNKKLTVDYETVMNIKSRFFKLIFDEKKETFLKSTKFKAFFNENKTWLVPYAAYSYLRDLFGTSDYSKWEQFSKINEKKLNELTSPDAKEYDDIAIHYFIQYHLHEQLLEAATYARENGVILKGDIPIGVNRNGIDTWTEPDLFNMESQSGAPPDDFSVSGQNWSFPTYNWDNMAKDDYAWWKARLENMSKYFDAFRIDHILGFFRIWEIDYEQVDGLLGHFNPTIPLGIQELETRGLWFDYNRFCKPYIRQYMLFEIFGDKAQMIMDNYLDEYEPGCYNLKSQFNTQRKIEQYFTDPVDTSLEVKEEHEKIKKGLFALVAEVLFLEVPNSNGNYYNPRISMSNTYSYKALDDWTKLKLDEIYLDYFFKRNEQFWQEQAMKKLPPIKNATNMLICGEDLGMVPDCVPGVMEELGVLSLNIQRMPKEPGTEFFHPSDSPYLSVCTPSCHDMSPIRAWWEEDKNKTQHFYNQMLGHVGPAPFFCEPWIAKEIIVQHLFSPCMWTVFPIQDLLALSPDLRREDPAKERINVPSNPHHYWKYRLHINLEDLLNQNEFNGMLNQLIDESGRNSEY